MADTEYTKGYRAGYEFARAEEQARIIGLLEQYTNQVDSAGKFADNSANAEWIRGFAMALALIKGEK